MVFRSALVSVAYSVGILSGVNEGQNVANCIMTLITWYYTGFLYDNFNATTGLILLGDAATTSCIAAKEVGALSHPFAHWDWRKKIAFVFASVWSKWWFRKHPSRSASSGRCSSFWSHNYRICKQSWAYWLKECNSWSQKWVWKRTCDSMPHAITADRIQASSIVISVVCGACADFPGIRNGIPIPNHRSVQEMYKSAQ